jgi:5-methylcytosine-specific restriction endonuclease McrBC GTP-binding regulatory subunit McrB
MSTTPQFYCVGFNWKGQNPSSQLDRFLANNIWENGYDDKFLDTVNNVPVGAKLAAKTSYTRKKNGKIISVLEVHAIGTVIKNHNDGQTLDVKWDKDFKPFTLDGRGAYRSTISQVIYPENIKLIFENGAKHKSSFEKVALTFDSDDVSNNFPSNLILYGPPGTGKTFHTINKAVSIADGLKEDKLYTRFKNRNALKDRFDELLIEDWDNLDGQIAFVTFHQSMSYEDFVEGIKPAVNDNKEVMYDTEPGIFKKIAAQAHSNWLDSQRGNLENLSFEDAFNQLRELWDENPAMKFDMKTKGKEFTIIDFTKSSIRFKKASGGTRHTLSISTLRDIFYHKKEYGTNGGVGVYYPGVLDKLRSFKPEQDVAKDEKNYVLIIDEINRGNISQIFGELITLIEEDKRLGEKEALSVTLPYSKEKFVVPPNLYIVGTMNTADRSVEALDTALRRRFVFEEIAPQPELLSPARMVSQLWWDYENKEWDDPNYIAVEKPLYALLGYPMELDTEDKKESYWTTMEKDGINADQTKLFSNFTFTGVNLSKLLICINKRIEKLLTKDHRIGHAYLIKVASVEHLKVAFQNKILPLLQEYFFGDYGRIGLVIGEVFIKSTDKEQKVDLMNVSGYEKGDLNDTKTYQIQNVFEWNDSVFIKNVMAIYGE